MPQRTITVTDRAQAELAIKRQLWPFVVQLLDGGQRVDIVAKPAKRSSEQNARMWAMLTEISEQVDWYGNRLTPEEWKDVFSAAMKRTKVVPGIDGGFVVCGQSTSRMTVSEMSEMQMLMEAFGAEKGVRFSANGST